MDSFASPPPPPGICCPLDMTKYRLWKHKPRFESWFSPFPASFDFLLLRGDYWYLSQSVLRMQNACSALSWRPSLRKCPVTLTPRLLCSWHLSQLMWALLLKWWETRQECVVMSVHFSCLVVSTQVDCSTPGLPAHHQLLEPIQTSIELVMLSNHLILCHPLLLPSIFPRIRVFSSELISSHQVARVLEFQLWHQWIFRTDFL